MESLEGREWGIAQTPDGLVIYILVDDNGASLYVYHPITREGLMAAASTPDAGQTIH